MIVAVYEDLSGIPEAYRQREFKRVAMLPGFVNCHSHAFQRNLRGKGESDYERGRYRGADGHVDRVGGDWMVTVSTLCCIVITSGLHYRVNMSSMLVLVCVFPTIYVQVQVVIEGRTSGRGGRRCTV